MRLLNTFCAVAPHLMFSCLVLVASIALPFIVLSAAIDRPIEGITSFFFSMNQAHRMADVMLIVVPLCVLYFLLGMMFAFEVGREKKVSEGLFVTTFVIPLAALALLQFPLYYYIIAKNEISLRGEQYVIAEATVFGVVAALVWVELFMAFVRAKSRVEQAQVEISGSAGSVMPVTVP